MNESKRGSKKKSAAKQKNGEKPLQETLVQQNDQNVTDISAKEKTVNGSKSTVDQQDKIITEKVKREAIEKDNTDLKAQLIQFQEKYNTEKAKIDVLEKENTELNAKLSQLQKQIDLIDEEHNMAQTERAAASFRINIYSEKGELRGKIKDDLKIKPLPFKGLDGAFIVKYISDCLPRFDQKGSLED